MDLKVALGTGRRDVARRILMKRLSSSPDEVNTWLLLGWISSTPEAARHYFNQALQLCPGYPLALDGLAYCDEWSASLSVENIGRSQPVSEVTTPAVITDHHFEMKSIAVTAPMQNQFGLHNETYLASSTLKVKVGVGKIIESPVFDQKLSLRILLPYLILITLAEALTTLFNPTAGVICHALVLVGLFVHGAFSSNRTFQRMLVTLSLAPLIRIVSLSLPLQDYAFYFWYLLVGAPLFVSAFFVARFIRLRPSEIGLRLSGWPLQLLFGFVGIALGYVEYLILRPKPLVAAFTLEQIWLPGLILIIFTGMLEEVIFRGLMQKAFIDGLGKLRGLFYVSIVFAVLHLGYHSVLDMVFVFGVALLFGLIVLRTRSILGVTLAHGLTNICLFLIFPFLVR